VKKSCFKLPFFLFCFALLLNQKSNAQLGFCDGNSGDAIFTEDFGTGLTDGPALPAGTTTYNFVTGTPNDGDYTISSTTNYFSWPNVGDRTPNDTNGKCLIVNASFTAGEFYRRTVNGLCENTTYEFSSWLVNLQPQTACDGNGIPVNVRFQIWDETDTNLLAQGDTGNIPNTNSPEWEQYALVFKTLPTQTSVILKMRNNSNGGCGNDLAIDDIAFSSCGDNITLANNQNEPGITVCAGQDVPTNTLQATPDFSIFTSHAYQWQESTNLLTWTDIPGANTDIYVTPTVNNTTYFRAKVAEDIVNLSNDLCNVISDIFEILIVPTPQAPLSNGNVSICENEIGVLTVDVPNTVTVNWYDAENNGVLLIENSNNYQPTVAGTYYAESVSGPINCISETRTPITLTINSIPQIEDETIVFCEGEITTLSADIDNANYLWNTGEITKEISITTQGEYTVEITNAQGCTATKQITVAPANIPVISDIRSDGSTILITLENSGIFEFALGSEAFQSSPIFENIPGGLYTISINYGDNCGTVSQEYIHLVIPKFFTPNSDNTNDLFVVEGLELFSSFELSIFNRFGQLLKNTNQDSPTWDGTLNGNPVPADTYWYQLTIEATTRNGYFTLKR
jgi:gliding motility-associated-like protein